MDQTFRDALSRAANIIANGRNVIAFTGAGISVESGLAPFRGPGGLWERYNPDHFHKRYFVSHPGESWATIKQLFYDHLDLAHPNAAHQALATLEHAGHLAAVITQNVDNLHRAAGSTQVIEYHGTLKRLDCLGCRRKHSSDSVSLDILPPPCPSCGGLLKPDIVFFGEPIPPEALELSSQLVETCDVMLVVGSTGEVHPAARLPHLAKNRSGAVIIEVNIEQSAFTDSITDIFLRGPAAATLQALAQAVRPEN